LPPVQARGMDELGLVNQKLDGRYLVKRLIGKGGMGAVYEVEADGGERLAAKVVSAGVQGANPSTLQRFAREAKASSAISSLNVVRTMDAGCDDRLGFPYIIMEMLHGLDLSTVMKREGALPSEVAVRLVVQAARGVAAAHARGVVHRDIKPANLFLNQDPRSSEITVKVCDFGVAKRVGSFGISSGGLSQYSLTRSGGMVGSPMYMSPEQARNAKAVDERTDVWSLSVVLWEALSGQRLWGGQSSLGELIVAICTEPIQRLEIAAPWVARDLARVVMRGLERDLGKRIPNVKALIESIEIFGGNSDRLVMSQIAGLTEEQRGELTLRVNLTDSAARRIADLGKNLSQKTAPIEIGTVSTIAASSRSVDRPGAGGSGKGAMIAVAALSAVIASGSAYYFASGPQAAAPPVAAEPVSASVNARVQVVPPDARVITRDGVLPIVGGEVVLRGQAGDRLNVTVSQGELSKTFAVSLGSDGIATPGRLVLQ
jgi:serine/threonine protein kinase